MKPILVKRGIGEGANTMDIKSGRASCYIRLGKIFRSLGNFEVGSLWVISRRKNNGEGWVVVTALESDAGMDSNDRNFIFGVCVAVLLNSVGNEVGILGLFRSAVILNVFADDTYLDILLLCKSISENSAAPIISGTTVRTIHTSLYMYNTWNFCSI